MKRKKFLLWTVIIFLLLCIIGLISFTLIRKHYRSKALAFDMSLVGKMNHSTEIYDVNNKLLGTIFLQNRIIVPFDKISKNIKNSVVATEDCRFYTHNGVDLKGFSRACWQNVKSLQIKQGGSSITQQLARNTFDIKERSISRKLLEMAIAERMEKTISKEQILENYLNLVYWGNSYYGIEAASLGYFDKNASDLTLMESAILAGMIKSPNRLNPVKNILSCRESAGRVLNQMVELKTISIEDKNNALAEIIIIKARKFEPQSHSIELVRQQIVKALGFKAVSGDGYKVYTTIDSIMQEKCEALVKMHISEPMQGAVLLIKTDGTIAAMVGSIDFKKSEYNRTIQTKRPAGTVFTPFLFASGCENNISPYKVVFDLPFDNKEAMIGGEGGILAEWENSKYEGGIFSENAFINGKNGAIMRYGELVGLGKFGAFCKKLGFDIKPYQGSYLGITDVSLGDLCVGYSALAGKVPESLYMIKRITNENNYTIFKSDVKVSKRNYSQTKNMLIKCFEKVGVPGFAGKCGSSYNKNDDWTIGFGSEYVCGVWAGFDKSGTPAYSDKVSLKIWKGVMEGVDGVVPEITGEPCEICKYSGLKAISECKSDLKLIDFECKSEITTVNILPSQIAECDYHKKRGRGFLVMSQSVINKDPFYSFQMIPQVLKAKKVEIKDLDSLPIMKAKPYIEPKNIVKETEDLNDLTEIRKAVPIPD